MKANLNSINVLMVISIACVVLFVVSLAVVAVGLEFHNSTVLHAGVIGFVAFAFLPLVAMVIDDVISESKRNRK